MSNEINVKKLTALTLIVILIILAILILKPIMLSIITGLLLAYIFYPVYKKVLSFVREKNISSLIIILLVFLILFLPIWFLTPIAVRQVFNIYINAQKIDITFLLRNTIPENLIPETIISSISSSVSNFISNSAGFVSSKVTSSLINLPNFLLQILIISFTLFFSMRDADKLRRYVKNTSPFSEKAEKRLVLHFKEITNSIIYGSVFVGLILGAVMGIGFFIFGVPNAFLFTILAAFAAIIPVLGVWIIWVPISIYLIATGSTSHGIGLAIYSIATTFALESIIRSYFISKQARVHSAIGLVGMIGGLFVFGVIGLILGPLILAYLIMLLEAYKQKDLSSLFS